MDGSGAPKDFSIDRNFVRFGTTSYATNKITSFTVKSVKRLEKGTNTKLVCALIAIVAGLVALNNLSDKEWGEGLMAVLVAAGFAFFAYVATDRESKEVTDYTLLLTTNAGEVAAFETTSAALIEEVKTSLERAMTDNI